MTNHSYIEEVSPSKLTELYESITTSKDIRFNDLIKHADYFIAKYSDLMVLIHSSEEVCSGTALDKVEYLYEKYFTHNMVSKEWKLQVLGCSFLKFVKKTNKMGIFSTLLSDDIDGVYDTVLKEVSQIIFSLELSEEDMQSLLSICGHDIESDNDVDSSSEKSREKLDVQRKIARSNAVKRRKKDKSSFKPLATILEVSHNENDIGTEADTEQDSTDVKKRNKKKKRSNDQYYTRSVSRSEHVITHNYYTTKKINQFCHRVANDLLCHRTVESVEIRKAQLAIFSLIEERRSTQFAILLNSPSSEKSALEIAEREKRDQFLEDLLRPDSLPEEEQRSKFTNARAIILGMILDPDMKFSAPMPCLSEAESSSAESLLEETSECDSDHSPGIF